MSFVPSRPFSFPRLSCIALLVASLGLASCGGDDDDPPPAPKQADLVGVLHGVLATSLQDELGIGAPVTDMSAAVDTLQDIVLFSDPNGIHDSHPALPLLKNALHSGRAVVLENVNADEVNALIKALGLRISGFTLPEGASVVELFAVRKVRGDTWFFVDVGSAQDKCPSEDIDTKIDVCGSSQEGESGEDGVRQQAQCDAATQLGTRPLGPTLAKAVRAEKRLREETQGKTLSPCENPGDTGKDCGETRTRALLDWAWDGREEADKPPKSVVLVSDNAPNNLMTKNYWQISYSPGCRKFITKYDIYSYHSFAEDMDYYYITQYGNFSPDKCWKNDPVNCEHAAFFVPDVAKQYGYMRDYVFEHSLPGNPRDPKYMSNPGNAVVTPSYTPKTAPVSGSVDLSKEFSVGGSVGFSLEPAPAKLDGEPIVGGSGVNASLSAGMTTGTTLSHSYQDASVTFTAKGNYGDTMNWRYDFLRPCSGKAVHCLYVVWSAALDYHDFQNATGLARNTFSPSNEWTWRVPSKYSRDYFLNPDEIAPEGTTKGFKTYFEARDGLSTGDVTPVIPVIDIQHVHHSCRMYMASIWYVPLNRPPLLAVDQSGLKDFPVGGDSQKVNLASEYTWKVIEDGKPDWVKVQPMKGEPTRKMSESEHAGWNGSTDLVVTAVPYETQSYDPRQDYVKICATDDKGDCIKGGEEVWIKVTQKAFN